MTTHEYSKELRKPLPFKFVVVSVFDFDAENPEKSA